LEEWNVGSPSYGNSGGARMGMFDTLRCRYPLPDGFTGDLEYQTKDTPA
jgi:hypothetical protein